MSFPPLDSAVTQGFVVTAPGRINLIGEHTDYNDGLVLPMAIDRHVSIRVTPRADRLAVWSSARESEVVTFDLSSAISRDVRGWAAYPAGVIAGFQKLGWEIPGFDAAVSADLPAGGGLSSSAALEVATATVLEVLGGISLPLPVKALLCQQAEHEYAGVPCGIMDQFAVTLARAGHALLLDCRDQSVRYVPMDGQAVSILVINSGVKHALVDGEYARRRAQCAHAACLLGVSSLRDITSADLLSRGGVLPELERKRVKHVTSEHDRTLTFVSALERADWKSAGEAMFASHESLRADYEVSCPELNALVDISRTIPGVYGCRMTGGGFGGCVIALVASDKLESAAASFRQAYLARTKIDPVMFVTRPAGGPAVTKISQ